MREYKKLIRQILRNRLKKEFIFKLREYSEEIVNFKGEIKNYYLLFEFLNEKYNLNVSSFEDLEKILNPTSREDNKAARDSKNRYIEIFSKTLTLKLKGENFVRSYKNLPEFNIKKWLAVENGENFFNIDENIVYLGGRLNNLTKEFLKDKEIIVFVDYDFAGMDIYESLESAKKSLYIPENIKELFKKYSNHKLYEKQSKKEFSSKEAKFISSLIAKYKAGLEQEFVNYEN